MTLLVGSALILCACVEIILGQDSPYTEGYRSYGGMLPSGVTEDGLRGPLLLTCFASFTDTSSNIGSELAVTIEAQEDPSANTVSSAPSYMDVLSGYGGYYGGPYGFNTGYGGYGGYTGFGGYAGYGGYGGYGGYSGYNEPYMSYSDSVSEPSNTKLSARIQLFANTRAKKAYVVFTERAGVEKGCSRENFGHVLTSNTISRDGRYGPAGFGRSPHTGLGYSLGFGHGLGYHGRNGYFPGYGSVYGMGRGFGVPGFGVGNEPRPVHPEESNEGVVTELTITPGALTTAIVDNIGFNDLSDLAGRGLMLCTDVTYDWDTTPVCRGEVVTCCALKYDNVPLSLVSTTQ